MTTPADRYEQNHTPEQTHTVRKMKESLHARLVRESKPPVKVSIADMRNTFIRNSTVYIICKNLCEDKPHWPIDTIVAYCMDKYKVYHVTREIISLAINDYIMSPADTPGNTPTDTPKALK